MRKLFSLLMAGGLVGATALPAFACGGGGGGCSTSGGGYGYGGGRAVAYGKVVGAAPMLAQSAPQTTRKTPLVSTKKQNVATAVRTEGRRVNERSNDVTGAK